MSDRLDREIRSLVVELIEASPAPHPAHRALRSRSAQPARLSLRSGLARMFAWAMVVLVVGLAGVWIGRNLVPADMAAEMPILAGTPAPEPGFDPSPLGEQVRLLPSSGGVQPDIIPGTLDGDVVAVGRIEGTDLEVFIWNTTDPENGTCLQVVGFRARHATCAGRFGDEPKSTSPVVFPRLDQGTGEAIDVVVVWEVPEGTSIVAATAGDTGLWQRPNAGVVAFILDPDTRSVILTALDTDRQTIQSTGISPRESVDPTADLASITIDLLDGSELNVAAPTQFELVGYFYFIQIPGLGETNVNLTQNADPAEAAAAESTEFHSDLGHGVKLWVGDREGRPFFMTVEMDDDWVALVHVGWETAPETGFLLSLADQLRGEASDRGVVIPNFDVEVFRTSLHDHDSENWVEVWIGLCLQELIPGAERVEHPERGEMIRTSGYASWCEPEHDLEVTVSGPETFVEQAVETLTLVRTPDL